MRIVNRALIALLEVYQNRVSAAVARRGYHCLHYPTCSDYAILALRKYGLFQALRVTVERLRACNPFSDRPYLDFP